MLTDIAQLFRDRFGGEPLQVFAPGRINLIGEHTDYHEGFVLPASIDLGMTFAMKANDTSQIRLYAGDLHEAFETLLPVTEPSEVSWANYILGVVAQFQEKGMEIGGFDCVFGGNLPIGAGLSSSAALESGVGLGLTQIFGWEVDRKTLALMGQKAEHTYVGVMCGIMDQFSSLMGKEGHVFKLDCRSLDYTYLPFPVEKYDILLVNSMVKHDLADSGYNERRQDSESGLAIIQQKYPEVQMLRDATLDQVMDEGLDLSPVTRKRCRYVVEENIRVDTFAEALQTGNYEALGAQMYASHAGLQHDYEVSCFELDYLVALSRRESSILGARMMGGGFGGCTINIVEKGKTDSFIDRWQNVYEEKYQKVPEYYLMRVGPGAHMLS
ncbi:MAG: galactokinase [Bacteroidota bacterium]